MHVSCRGSVRACMGDWRHRQACSRERQGFNKRLALVVVAVVSFLAGVGSWCSWSRVHVFLLTIDLIIGAHIREYRTKFRGHDT